MNFSQLCAEVYTLTRRPDLVDRTEQAVRAAVLRAHHTDFYAKDLFETAINFGESDTIHTFEYAALFPRWRSVKYIRRIDSTTQEVIDPPLGIITPENLFDSYSQYKEDVFYQAGLAIKIRTATAYQYFQIGFYQNPQTAGEDLDSWIAIEFPFAIIYDAAARVMRGIGYEDQAKAMQQDAGMEYLLLKQTGLASYGY